MSKLQEKPLPLKTNIQQFVGHSSPPKSGPDTDPGTPLNPDPQHSR